MLTSRRSFLSNSVSLLGAGVLAPSALRSAALTPAYSARTLAAIKSSTVIDMLGLITLDYRKLCAWQDDPKTFTDEDFARLQRSGITILHPAVGFVNDDAYKSSWNDLARWNRFIDAHPEKFLRVLQSVDIQRAKETNRIGILLGFQNSQHFRTVDDVDMFYGLGQRVSQLTYYDNRLGGGSTESQSKLTPYGLQIIERMNKLGMAVDVSHCSDRTTLDAIDASSVPVLITHSNCRALVSGSARCKADDAIRRLAARGGVFGVTMVRPFVRSGGPTTIEDVLNHIDHVAQIAGVEHVGIGSDVDLIGRDSGGSRRSDLDALSYANKVFEITEGLVRRGYDDRDIALILGGNFQRALATIFASSHA